MVVPIAPQLLDLRRFRGETEPNASNSVLMTEILTVAELAAMLKMSNRQIYEMTTTRTRTGSMRENPLPVVRINGNLRFRKSDVEEWIEKLVARGR